MADERKRLFVDPAYTSALGLAVYCFASLEWNAVWCCERIEPGSVDALEERTAGRVADTLIRLVERVGTHENQVHLHNAAIDFRNLVATRNNLVHAKPGTASDGSQGLFRHGDQWMLEELERTADSFAECSVRLNVSLNGILREPRPAKFDGQNVG